MTSKATDFITLNAHSSVRLETDNSLILRIDPFLVEDEPHDSDVILFTHSHFDHFSPEDVKRVWKPETIFVAPISMAEELAKAGFKEKAVLLYPGEETLVYNVPVHAVPSYNINKPNHPKKNGWLGYILTIRGLRIYIAGDTDDTEEVRSIACDIALLPVGGTYTMNVREAANCVNVIRPTIAIPTHYGSIVGTPKDGETFRDLVAPGIQVELKL